MSDVPATTSSPSGDGQAFDAFARAVQARFDAVTADGARLFLVDAPDLAPLYLDALPPAHRPYHACAACRTFLRRFGALATVARSGAVTSAPWLPDKVPEIYRASAAAMARAVGQARITAPFLAAEAVWGLPEAGGFAHLALRVPEALRDRGIVVTPRQAMAARREDFRTLSQAISEFDRSVVARAVTLLRAESLYRAEKVAGPAEFLLRLHDELPRKDGPARDALIWRAVATAPPGFCTPRGAMIGTLLEDIAAGLPFGDVKRRFDAKMHPLLYQRPQAAPSAGTIARAERLFATMGLGPALRRRFARLDEVPTLWRLAAAPTPPSGEGLFGHLVPKVRAASPPALEMPPQDVTWAKFARDVLPDARRMAVFTEPTMTFCGLVTAVDPDAPPILQWDREGARNPVSWYVYQGGSTPARWGLPQGSWVAVTGVVLSPALWAGEDAHRHQGRGAVLVLDGAQDTNVASLCLFPETLRSELHGVRAVIEAYARAGKIEGAEEGSANGLLVGQGGAHRLRVEDAVGTAHYHIDRWE